MAKVDPYFKSILGEDPGVGPAYKEELEYKGADVTDPVEIFSKGVSSGAYNLAANLDYFQGIGNSIMGDQEALAKNLEEAEYLETQGAIQLQDVEQFDEFLENPTFTGFVGQVASATGQFTPSAVASIGAALSGAGAGVAVAGLSGVTKGLVNNVVKKEVRRAYTKKLKNKPLTPDEEDLLNGAYQAHKGMRLGTAAKLGAVGGAVAQEYPQGAGIAFGTYADEDMIDPVSAFRATAIGVPFAAIGVGAEALVFKGLKGILTNKGTGPVHKRILNAIGEGAGRTAAVEGVTELAQEELTVQQRFSIDDDYKQSQANLDRAQALFAGFFGGVGIGAAGGTVAGGLRAVTGNNIVEGAREALKQGYEAAQYRDFLKERYGTTKLGETAVEPEGWFKAQTEAMFDPTNQKDSLFVDSASISSFNAMLNANPELRDRLSQTPQHSAADTGAQSAGILFSLNPDKVKNFKQVTDDNLYDTNKMDEVLVDILQYEHGRLPDADRVVEVRDANDNVVWYQSTNAQQEGFVKQKARELFPNTEPVTADLDDHLGRRAGGKARAAEFNEDGEPIAEQETVETEEEALAAFQLDVPNIANEPGIRQARADVRGPLTGTEIGDGWARSASKNEELQEEAKSYFPPFAKYSGQMNQDLESGFYSDSLLKTYVNYSTANPNNIYTIQPIDAAAENVRYEIKRLNTTDGQIEVGLGIPTVVTEAVKNENARIFKGKEATGWKIKTPNSTQFQPVYMPALTILGRRINTKLGEATQGASDLQSAQEGFNTIYSELLEQGYELQFPGQQKFNLDFSKSNATVYTAGAKKFSYKQLQPGRAGVTPFRGNAESDIKNLKEQIISTGLVTEGYVENINTIEGLERVVEEEINPNLDADQKILTPTRREAGEFFEQESGDFAEATPEQERTAEYKAATFAELGTTDRKIPAPAKVDITDELGVRMGEKNFIPTMKRLLRNNFQIKRNVSIYHADVNIDRVLPLTKETSQQFNFIKAQQKVLNDSNARARIVSFGNQDIIFVKARENAGPAEQGAAMLGLAHELGHVVYNQELANSLKGPMYDKLYASFAKDRDATDAPQQYQGKYGFEEWYSDKVASYLFSETKKATNGVESFFKRIANKIRAAFKALSAEVFKRFQQNPDFADYVQNLTKSYKEKLADPQRSPIASEQARFAQFVVDETAKIHKTAGTRGVFESIKKNVAEMVNDPAAAPRILKKVFYPADNFLKSLGKDKGIGKELAGIFYSPSQTQAATGLLTANIVGTNAEVNKLSQILGLDDVSKITPEAEAILVEAEDNNVSNDQLSEQARQVREWLSDFYDRQQLNKIGLAKIPNYFPRLIAVAEISENTELQDALANLLVKNNPELQPQSARQLVENLIADPDNALLEGNETDGAGRFNLGLAKERAKLFREIPTKELRDAGLIESPAIAVRKYLSNSIKRSEFNKRGGAKKVAELISQLPENEQGHAIDAVDAIMGRVNPNMGGTFRFINSWGLVANITTLLAFAVFASLPDLAGPTLRSKEFNLNAFRELGKYITNKEEAARFAKDIGVVSTDAINTMYVNAGELDFMSKDAKFVSEKFFQYTGLEWYTRFTRVFAAGMGRRFLLEHQMRADQGDVRSQRYLKELNVTSEQIKNWNNSQNVEAHPEVKLALARFVDESIVRPNAAERPVWASDPRLALIWQLKSFFYAYGKNIVGGLSSEMRNRSKEQGVNGALMPLALAATTLLPLSMLGLDLRERFKVGLAWALPGASPDDKNYRRSLDMDWDEYSFEVLDRSGIFGPFTLAFPLFMESKRYGDPFWVGPLGPSVEKGYDLLTGDLDFEDVLPIYNQIL